jgi:hypothetical protein
MPMKRGKYWSSDDSISPTNPTAVIPAQAGIHLAFDFIGTLRKSKWIPACAGMTISLFHLDDFCHQSEKT